MRELLLYSLLRLALFGAVWGLLYLAGFHYLLGGALAAIIALLLSVLFLRRPRQEAATSWQAADEARKERRAALPEDQDAEDEDALLDAEDRSLTDRGTEDEAPRPVDLEGGRADADDADPADPDLQGGEWSEGSEDESHQKEH